MDYSLTQAMKYKMEGIPVAIVSYDVMCQYMTNFQKRVHQSPYLELPNDIEIRQAIGLFHIHGHQDSCLPRYSPSFVEGARQLDGEIIETLWAPLNEISRSTRGMSTAHRREIIDDHMNNSNWKKLITSGSSQCADREMTATDTVAGIVSAICKQYKKAVIGLKKSTDAFEALTASMDRKTLREYNATYATAMKERKTNVAAMDVFDTKSNKGELGEA